MKLIQFKKLTTRNVNIFFNFFLIGLVFIGLNIFQDYGISWDETFQREHAITSLGYIADLLNIEHPYKNLIEPLSTYKHNSYGVAFTMPLVIIEYFFNIKDTQDMFFMRHLATHLFFLLSMIPMYLMAKKRFNGYLAIIAVLFLIISPRIYADSFYNIKDLVFLSSYLFATYTAIMFILSPSLLSSFLAAFFNAYAVDVRITAVIVPVLLIGFFITRFFKNEIEKKDFIFLLNFIFFLVLFIILMWPMLWQSPINNFIESFQKMSNYPWQGSVLYMGQIIKATNLPWHYILVWIGISTPIFYLFLFLIGFIKIIRLLALNHIRLWKSANELHDYLFFSFFFVPLGVVIYLNSVLYDGWRHMYFIYPFFILIALNGLNQIFEFKTKIFKLIILILAIQTIISTIFWMYKYHPMGNVYFNFLAGENIHKNYDVDYHGLSNRKALEYILANDDAPNIIVSKISFTPENRSVYIIDKMDRERLIFVEDYKQADYIINNFRYLPLDFDSSSLENFKKIVEFKTDKTIVLEIYKKFRSEE
jgi:hypothetical protein